ncbi:hypothetical protein CH296_00535 [Rhodococcus sp. 14-2496-1d]|uniref:DUF6197 family protein n=1 Tax=Rhodococcus sp. 14-2496-1d TaxID=2023146 RepID=UPI000B9A7D73|nr:hypothetical protein [Rhodococcus sp. 14-2496-1d]OZF40777.1 hypothetical protein CH296_00535 [Rhodococcus sp. 14-2496-1d]
MTISEILARAADLIEEHGWMQGEYVNDKGCLCAVGAIRIAADGKVEGHFPSNAATQAIDLMAGHLDAGSVIEWNDDVDRTQTEVVGALRAAATRAANLNITSEEQS